MPTMNSSPLQRPFAHLAQGGVTTNTETAGAYRSTGGFSTKNGHLETHLQNGRPAFFQQETTDPTNKQKSISMKLLQTSSLLRGVAAVAGGFAAFTTALSAAPFLYGPGDLVVAFRKSGGASDLVVNIGKATNYNNVPLGTTVPITNLTLTQLSAAFANFNSLSWSVAAANRPPIDPNYALQTIWATAPRLDPNTPSAPLLRKGQYVQGPPAAQIDGIGVNAASYSGGSASNANNTAVGVVIASSSDYALKYVIGDGGNYAGTFQANVETTTANSFASDSNNVSRADLYELIPGSFSVDNQGRFLGYFEFKPDGSLTFKNALTPPPAPSITAVVRAGNVTTVSFTTVSSATYRLRFSNEAGLTSPVATWAIGGSVSGDGAVKSLQDTSTGGIRFFSVDAQR
jgi:hypothetical protein